MDTPSVTIIMTNRLCYLKPGPHTIQFLTVEFKLIVKGCIFGACGSFLRFFGWFFFLVGLLLGVWFNLNLEIEKDKYTKTVLKLSRILQTELQNGFFFSPVLNGA